MCGMYKTTPPFLRLLTAWRGGTHHEVDGRVGGRGVGGGHGDARPGEEARVPGPLLQEGNGAGALCVSVMFHRVGLRLD